MKQYLILLGLVIFGPIALIAATSTGPGCDTLLTTDGRTVIIKEVKRSATELQYYACDDPTQTLVTLPASAVRQVRREGHTLKGLAQNKAAEQEAEQAIDTRGNIVLGMGIFTLVSLVLAVFSGGTFVLMTLLAGTWAVTMGWLSLRKWKNKTGHEKAFSRMRTGMILGAIGLVAVLASVLLLV